VAQTFARTIKRGVLGLIIVAFIAGIIPTRYLAAPHWDVSVRDESGAPLAGLNVRLSFKNYSAESDSHEITLVTDQSGHVAFPSQFRSASLLQRAFYTIGSAIGGVHASFGNHAFVFVFGGGYEGDAVTGPYVTDWTGSPTKMASTVVAKRMKNAH
jgi:hypothetical protein